jgi:Rrf2 family iron-sulfur cluster assembly transcriptional regulator
MTHDLWASLNKTIYDYLSSVTLAQLVEQQHEKQRRREQCQQSVLMDQRPGRTTEAASLLPGL